MSTRPVQTRRDARRGFTLPEVLATLLLIGIVLPAALKGLMLAMAASADARKKVEAAALAENVLADLSSDVMSGTQGSSRSGDFGEDRPGYRWESQSVSTDTGATEVSVRVSWTSRGRERSVVLSTIAYGSVSSTTGTEAEAPAGGGT